MTEIIKHSLDGIWNLSFTAPDGAVYSAKAPVPGNVEPVLVELGLIEDYMPADSEYATSEFETVDDWCYTTTFDADFKKGWTHQLVIGGIDTIAEIYLNGEKLQDCANMHLEYKLDVTDKLKAKDNELKIVIRSSDLWARERLHDMFAVSHDYSSLYDSQAHLRKARHQWGWDNAPRLISAGIVRSVYIEELPVRRFDDVYLYTFSIDEDNVSLGVNWVYNTDKKCLKNHKTRITVLDGDEVIHQHTSYVYFVQGSDKFSIPRDKVSLWWPAGFGEPKLYTVRVEMLDGEAVVADYEAPFGIRTLRLDHTEDMTADGGEFVFRVNGEKVFIKGANWKPLDALASRAHQKTAQLRALEDLKELNCNMIRIWGGGIYEAECFFEYCDRNGIMVWQDFMFACEVPAGDEEYCRAVEEEAVQVIKRFRNYASLAIWCGDNEDDECLAWVNYPSTLLPSDNVISRKILKRAVLCYDPYRSYVESSPYRSDESYRQMGNPTTHFQLENHFYPQTSLFSKLLRENRCMFIGETGPIKINSVTVNPEIIKREESRARRLWDTPNMCVPDYRLQPDIHQTDCYFTVWRSVGKELCQEYYGRDFTFDEIKDYALAANVICAEVFKDVLEYCRTMRWSKTGVIWWSAMDMWPMLFNYSIIDCDYKRKLGYYWIKQSQQDFLLMGVRTEAGGELSLYAANDTLEEKTVEYTVTAYDTDGSGRVIASGICRQDKNSTGLIQRIAESEKPQLWIIRWTADGRECANHAFTSPKVPYEVMRRWVEIIGRECGFADELEELK